MDDPVRVLVNQKVSSSVLRDYCIKNHGMQTMRLDGLEKMKLGMTTYEEVKRVTGEG
jgi:type II secretory ATPase GspE/PulE/Tfp pilus assembly ATPase PilB-like protein